MILARHRKKVEWTRARIATVVLLSAGLSVAWTNLVLTFLGRGVSVLWLVAAILSFSSVICNHQVRRTKSIRTEIFCNACGAALSSEPKFCGNCGTQQPVKFVK